MIRLESVEYGMPVVMQNSLRLISILSIFLYRNFFYIIRNVIATAFINKKIDINNLILEAIVHNRKIK
ncbi:hypothetical protein [Rickettsia felis]|uniref:hypothetical protein n=1 Tax=Rickettsia felis TaxID=42862 RepID=UPI001F22AB88|nr:hypothetical protein [Rickettsia felis]